MKKILIIGAILVVAVIGVGVYVVMSSLDSVVKAAVEQIGSDATGTKVTLKDVEISPTSGHGALRGFRMTNPQGFAEGDAFKFDEVSLTIDVSTILSDPVVIKEIVIAKPEITYTIGKSSTNVDEIQNNVNDYASAQESASGGGGGGGSEGPKFIIENLYLRGGTVMVSAPAVSGETLSAPLPDIHLTDIGADGNGATPGEVARQAMAAIAASARQAVKTVELDVLLKGAGEMTGEAQKQLEKATEGSEAAIEGATESLKKLLE